MMTQKLILKATAALTLVGLSGGLLAVEQPKKNEQLAYRFVKGTANGLGNVVAYTAQTKINFWHTALKKPVVSLGLGAFVVAPVLRQTLFSVTPETNVKELAKKVVLHSIHDAKQAKENATIGYASLAKWLAPKAEIAQNAVKQATEKAVEVKQQANEKYEALQKNEQFQEVSKRTQEAGKNASLWLTDKAAAFAQWIQNLRK